MFKSFLDMRINIDKTSGQKTTMVFSNNVSEQSRNEIRSLWENGVCQQYEKYIGLPPIIERSNRKDFVEIKSKMWEKLQM